MKAGSSVVLNASPDAVAPWREPGGAHHSRWSMTARISPEGGGTLVSIDLEYGGTLWTAGVLDKVLASNIDEGKKGLARVVSGPRH